MSTHPLTYEYITSALVADRLSQAASRTRAVSPVEDLDLAMWSRHVGDRLASISLDRIPDGVEESMRELVGLLYEAARDAGVETDLTPREDDPPVVLMRMLGALAGRAAGRSIPVSQRRSSQIRAALRRIPSGLSPRRVSFS